MQYFCSVIFFFDNELKNPIISQFSSISSLFCYQRVKKGNKFYNPHNFTPKQSFFPI